MEVFFNHLNPAVIKNIILRMNEAELIEVTKFIKNKALTLPIGTKRNMYVRLFAFCKSTYIKKYKQKSLLF